MILTRPALSVTSTASLMLIRLEDTQASFLMRASLAALYSAMAMTTCNSRALHGLRM